MASIEIHIDDDKIHDLLGGDDVFGALMHGSLNDFLQAEMTEHVGAAPGERTTKRRGHRNGSYRRGLTTRVGRIRLEYRVIERARSPRSFLNDISAAKRHWFWH